MGGGRRKISCVFLFMLATRVIEQRLLQICLERPVRNSRNAVLAVNALFTIIDGLTCMSSILFTRKQFSKREPCELILTHEKARGSFSIRSLVEQMV